ncbi:MAG: Gfo/Idh/MocA family oxidoreductase [Clostridia bacterium]|nr:Gfo/Idh/MocA family oxidoreductase [Clostridia bacterium]
MLKVGLIGCGRISVMHLDAIDKLPQAQLVCCCDIKKDRADNAAKKYGVKAYYDYKQMIDTEK